MSINLAKGQKIDLTKNNSSLEKIFLGLNWGMIESKGFFGGTSKKSVDLDASCAVFDENKKLLNIVYFGKLKNPNGSIQHSGDDLTGDSDGDDGLDNEIIAVDLKSLPKEATQIIFILNSFQGQDFATIPFARIRIFEGSFSRVDNVIATFDIANDEKFSGYVSMIMGKLYKTDGEWKFSAIGEPTQDKKLQDSVNTAKDNFL